jgi:CubicO group peptidase (beta-lactamase class C family)
MTLSQALTQHIEGAIASGREEGIQLCVYHHGQMIVDITRGTRDDAGTPLTPDDLVLVWSTSKGITATAMHILAERKLIEYDDAVARYSPSSARHGKDAISIRHIMSHTAGIPHLPANTSLDVHADYDAVCAVLANMTPVSRAGQIPAYHGLTYGLPLAKVLEAVDGRRFGQFIQDEICTPLGITDLFFGLPADRRANAARLTHDLCPNGFANNPGENPTLMANHPGIQATCFPAANMMASARSIARVYASLIGNGVDGVRLLPNGASPWPPKSNAGHVDQTLVNTERGFGLGYFLGQSLPAMGLRDTTFGHDGFGGAIGFADPVHGLRLCHDQNPDDPHPQRTVDQPRTRRHCAGTSANPRLNSHHREDIMSLTHALTNHIDAAIADGREAGIQLCVYHHGQMIVDITRGTRDASGAALRPDDLVWVWSTSKGITATAMHVSAEQNLIRYDDTIASYWPSLCPKRQRKHHHPTFDEPHRRYRRNPVNRITNDLRRLRCHHGGDCRHDADESTEPCQAIP